MEKHADKLDAAAQVTEEAVSRSVAEVRKQAAKIDMSNPSGKCWCCGEQIGDRRWCDAECRNLWQAENE